MEYVLAYDLGTGGIKASIYNESGVSVTSAFVSCDTEYPKENYKEQRPMEWWAGICQCTQSLLNKAKIDSQQIKAIGVSGHSLGVVPINQDGQLLCETVPIWSDARATEEAEQFFETVSQEGWYQTTGNGFPSPLYSIFKIMWYKNNKRNIYDQAMCFLGTKDYINFKLTGFVGTDYSYASGSGVYNLMNKSYDKALMRASGIPLEKMPKLYHSHQIIGYLKTEVAKELGLPKDTAVVCGGVDNACMALGAGCIDAGDVYTSLGTSAWIAVSGSKPVLDVEKRPYVFAHCIEDMYVSATAIFSAGNSYRWVRDQLCQDLVKLEAMTGVNAYEYMNELAEKASLGSGQLLFNPSLAGGSSIDKSANIRGGFVGLTLGHTREDMIRATLEGICMNLKLAMDILEQQVPLSNDMLIVGGGSKSRFWMELFAHIYDKVIFTTNVGQDAGSLGAAALAFVGAGIWTDYRQLSEIHHRENTYEPEVEQVKQYSKILKVFGRVADYQSDIGDMLSVLIKEI